MKHLGSSWRTSSSGIALAVGIFVATCGPQFNTLFDNDPATMPDWSVIGGSIAALLGALGLGMSSRDNKVTSEQAGAKK